MDEPDEATTPVGRRARPDPLRWPLWWHAAALLVLLVALVPVVHSGEPGFPDEALYSAQADNLAGGSWWNERSGTDIDRDGLASANSGSIVDGDRELPYVRHPLVPLLYVPFHAVGGLTGLLVASVLGTWASAVLCAVLARRMRPGTEVVTLWLLGVGSPLLFDAYVGVPHSIAAALAALVVLLVVRAFPALLGRERAGPVRWWPAAGSVLAGAALVAVRSEGTFVVAALGGVLALSSLERPDRGAGTDSRWSLDTPRALVGGALVGVAAAVVLVDGWAVRRISGGLEAAAHEVVRDPDPLSSASVSLLQPWRGHAINMTVTMVIVLLCAVAAPIVFRLLPRRPIAGSGLLVLAAGAAVVHQLPGNGTPSGLLISGLLPAFPALAVGLLSLRRRTVASPLVVVLLATATIAAVAVTLTVYGVGGGLEWGGRFYHVLLPLLVPVAVLGLDDLRLRLPRPERAIACVALVVLTLAMSVLSLRANHQIRELGRNLVQGTDAFIEELQVDPSPPVFVSPLVENGVSRLFWERARSGVDVLNPGSLGMMHQVLRAADRDDLDALVVVTDVEAPLLHLVLRRTLGEVGWSVDPGRPLRGSSMYVHVLRRDAGPEEPPA